MWAGHWSLYLFPAIGLPISLAAYQGFNTIYIMWQQYMTFLTGLLLSLTISGLFAYSYSAYETESGLDQQTILNEGISYFVTTTILFVMLARNNENFQRYYQNIYASPPVKDLFYDL